MDIDQTIHPMTSKRKLIYFITAFLIATYVLFLGLIKAKAFLAPLFIAVTLSLLMLPLSQRMERKLSRFFAAFLNSFILFLVSVGIIFLVFFQVRSFTDEWPQLKENLLPRIEKIKEFVVENTPFSEKEVKKIKNKESKSLTSLSGAGTKVTGFLKSLLSFLGNYLLTFIYVFFLLAYRRRFKNFLIRVFPDRKRDKVKDILSQSVKVVPRYLRGRLILIVILAVLYAIGLGISGVSNFILVSVFAAILSIIPYIGNIIAFLIAVVFGFLTGGNLMTLVGIMLTFSIAQFVESYILEPYIVGDKVDVHPFFVILAVILGNMVWGVVGMVLAIPVLGIITVILINIKELRPYGILLSKEDFKDES